MAQDLSKEIQGLKDMLANFELALIKDRDTCPSTFSEIAGEHTKSLQELKIVIIERFTKQDKKIDDINERLLKVEPISEIFSHITWLRSSFVSFLIFLSILGGGIAVIISAIGWLKSWVAAAALNHAI